MCACVPCERGGCIPGRAMHMPVDLPCFISRVVSVLMCEVRDLSFTCGIHGIWHLRVAHGHVASLHNTGSLYPRACCSVDIYRRLVLL